MHKCFEKCVFNPFHKRLWPFTAIFAIAFTSFKDFNCAQILRQYHQARRASAYTYSNTQIHLFSRISPLLSLFKVHQDRNKRRENHAWPWQTVPGTPNTPHTLPQALPLQTYINANRKTEIWAAAEAPSLPLKLLLSSLIVSVWRPLFKSIHASAFEAQ